MAVDLTVVPWNRLAKLAPPGTNVDDLQQAADNHSTRTDVYAAAADLWEDLALSVDITNGDMGTDTPVVSSVSQDGISVTYANDPLAGNGLSARVASRGQMLATARRLRLKSKPSAPLMHDTDYDAWTGHYRDDCESIIVVDEV